MVNMSMHVEGGNVKFVFTICPLAINVKLNKNTKNCNTQTTKTKIVNDFLKNVSQKSTNK